MCRACQAYTSAPAQSVCTFALLARAPPQLMEEHGVGYSTTGLVAQMREQGFAWKQASARCCPATAAADCVLVHGGSLWGSAGHGVWKEHVLAVFAAQAAAGGGARLLPRR